MRVMETTRSCEIQVEEKRSSRRLKNDVVGHSLADEQVKGGGMHDEVAMQ